MITTGIDSLLQSMPSELRGSRVGLVTNHTGVTRNLTSTIDALIAHPDVEVAALFGPEHGVRGAIEAGDKVGHTTDPQTGLPAYSLYGDTRQPNAEMLDGIDALIFDIQDVGVRFYTYQSTMLGCIEACAEHDKLMVVLDRPNPIGGDRVEGGTIQPEFFSFIGSQPTSVRHGMTFGELATMYAASKQLPAPMVIQMQGWNRSMWWNDTGLPWVAPSPNMPSVDTASLYPGTCLIEGTSFSEGRGTTLPFQQLGAPWIDAHALAATMNTMELPGIRFRPTWFTPTFSKNAGKQCAGVQVHVIDRDLARPLDATVHLIAAMRAQDVEQFSWVQFTESRPHFVDLLTGDTRFRECIDQEGDLDALLATWQQEADAFTESRKPYLLY